MKVLFDTNVIVAAYATHGACNELFNHCLARHTMYTSEFVLGEVQEKLVRKIKLTVDETDLIVHFLRQNCLIVAETKLPGRISRDRDDDHVLAAALAAKVACIITGDKDLLDLEKFQGVQIVKPADFWKIEVIDSPT